MKLLCIILISLLEVFPKGPAFLNPLQKRDSVAVADQLEYGFEMKGVKAGTRFGLPDYSKTGNEDIVLVKNWELDTTKIYLRTMTYDLKARVVMAFFQEGEYQLNPIVVVRQEGEQADTLMFTGAKLEVKTMPVDTATPASWLRSYSIPTSTLPSPSSRRRLAKSTSAMTFSRNGAN